MPPPSSLSTDASKPIGSDVGKVRDEHLNNHLRVDDGLRAFCIAFPADIDVADLASGDDLSSTQLDDFGPPQAVSRALGAPGVDPLEEQSGEAHTAHRTRAELQEGLQGGAAGHHQPGAGSLEPGKAAG